MSESVVVLNPIHALIADSASSSAFGRLRVANPLTLWDTQFQYDKAPLLWDEVKQGGASVTTHLANESAIGFTVAAGATDFITRQTRNYIRYKPGKSQLVITTGVVGQQTNQYRRMGYFDADNGVFFETDGTTMNIVLRSKVTGSVVETRVAQADWNLNKLNGVGGGTTLDPTKVQIFALDLEWLGSGRVRTGFFIGGNLIYVHEFLHSNVNATTYITTANLPIRYEVRNYAAQSGTTTGFKQICSTAVSEGGEWSIAPDQIRSAPTSLAAPKTIPITTITPVISVRLKEFLNSIVNRGMIQPIGFDILVAASKNIYWELRTNPTLTGATTWTETDPNSIAEVNLDATAVSGGIRIASGFAAGVNQSKGFSPLELRNNIGLSRSFDNTSSDIFTLSMVSLEAGSSDAYVSVQWAEFATV
jgi:hypothetical protein